MMNFLTRTSFGLEGQVRVYRKKDELIEFALFPMVHVAATEFYEGVATELEKCDLILYEGVRSAKAGLIVRIYEIVSRSPRLGLVLQRDALDLSSLRDRLIHADQEAAAFEERWRQLSLGARLWIRFVGPAVGFFGYLTLNRERLAKLLEPSSLPAQEYWEDESTEELPSEVLAGGDRDKHIVSRVKACFETNRGREMRVGVLFGAAHAEVVGTYLRKALGFHVTSATRLMVFGFNS